MSLKFVEECLWNQKIQTVKWSQYLTANLLPSYMIHQPYLFKIVCLATVMCIKNFSYIRLLSVIFYCAKIPAETLLSFPSNMLWVSTHKLSMYQHTPSGKDGWLSMLEHKVKVWIKRISYIGTQVSALRTSDVYNMSVPNCWPLFLYLWQKKLRSTWRDMYGPFLFTNK